MWPFSQNGKENTNKATEKKLNPPSSSLVVNDKEKTNNATEKLSSSPSSLVVSILSNPFGSAVVGISCTSIGFFLYWRYFRRILNAEYLTPSTLRWRKVLVGRVISVGDADGFRLLHTPGPPLYRSFLFLHLTKGKKLKEIRSQTLSIRIAGVDAPETAHFGKPAQPFSKEAQDFLQKMVLGKTVWVDTSHVDQYKRLVATPYVWLPPYFLGKTNVSLEMVKKGLATVYRSAGAHYGSASWWRWIWVRATNGLGSLEAAETKAKNKKLGIWSQGKNFESPEEYKKRYRSETPSPPP